MHRITSAGSPWPADLGSVPIAEDQTPFAGDVPLASEGGSPYNSAHIYTLYTYEHIKGTDKVQ